MNELSANLTPGQRVPSIPTRETNPSKAADHAPASKASFKEILAKEIEAPDSSHEIRRDLVDQYKRLLNKGTYEVKADELAEKMVQKIRENKSRVII